MHWSRQGFIGDSEQWQAANETPEVAAAAAALPPAPARPLPAPPLSFSCHCGATQLEGAGEALSAYFCHCEPCRQLSGSDYAHNALFEPDQVRLAERIMHEFHRCHMSTSLPEAGSDAEVWLTLCCPQLRVTKGGDGLLSFHREGSSITTFCCGNCRDHVWRQAANDAGHIVRKARFRTLNLHVIGR